MPATILALICALASQTPEPSACGPGIPFPEFARPCDSAVSEAIRADVADLSPAMREVVKRLAPALDGSAPRPEQDPDHALWRLPRSGSTVLVAAEGPNPGRSMMFALLPTASGDVVVNAFPFQMLSGAHWMSVAEADVDGDGHVDALVRSSAAGCGLGASAGADWIILMRPGGERRTPQATCLELPDNFGVTPLDVDRNGRMEFLVQRFGSCTRCTDGKPHNFWVWELVGIQDGRLVDLNATVRDFPRFEWLSFDPKDRWRPLLTPAMKAAVRGDGPGLPKYRRRQGAGEAVPANGGAGAPAPG